MSEELVKYVHRICPCAPCDVEGIQSWLEDQAAEGLFLAEDGVFCGVFSFERKSPRRVKYRLDVAQKRKPKFLDSGDELTDEELELYRSMGWEYLLRYGDFRVYRSMERDAPELNTESETHAITIGLLKQKHRSSFISAVLMTVFWLVFSHSALRYSFQMAVNLGLAFVFCVYGVILDAWLTNLLKLIRFRGYEKRLLHGDSLNHRVEWKKNAPVNYLVRILPFFFSFVIVFALLSGLSRVGSEIPHEQYTGEIPFATVADVFPDGTLGPNNDFMDYGTVMTWSTALAKNYEWTESRDVIAADGEKYFCILRLSYHETESEWIARGLEQDYYEYDSTRHRGKRFQDLDAPELDVDSISIRVYNSYGSFYVLMREGNRVIHAVVLLDNQTNQNQWHLWAEAMAEKLK